MKKFILTITLIFSSLLIQAAEQAPGGPANHFDLSRGLDPKNQAMVRYYLDTYMEGFMKKWLGNPNFVKISNILDNNQFVERLTGKLTPDAKEYLDSIAHSIRYLYLLVETLAKVEMARSA